MKLVCDYTLNTKKQIVDSKVASFATNIVFGTNYRSNRPQNGPTFHVHASQVFHNRKKKKESLLQKNKKNKTTNVAKNLKQSCEIDLQRKFQ
jgi:hypothetical protein